MVDTDYTSYGRYAPVYDHAVDRLYECLPVVEARQAEKVLRAYAQHASNIGTCYPGIDRMKECTHYSETTIKRCWKWLGELDFIRVHQEYSAARRKATETFQISPFVLFIRPEYIKEAEMLWMSTNLKLNEIIHGQPESVTRISNQNQNQNQSTRAINHHHHHQKNPGMENDLPGENGANQKQRRPAQNPKTKTQGSNPDKPNQRNAPKTKTQAENDADQNQRVAPDQSPTPNSAPPPSQKRDYTPFNNPLPDANHEMLAQSIKIMGTGTHIRVARAMIGDYGYATVLAVRNYVEREVYHGRCFNPVGLLVVKLKSGAVQPGEKIGFDIDAAMRGDYDGISHWNKTDANA